MQYPFDDICVRLAREYGIGEYTKRSLKVIYSREDVPIQGIQLGKRSIVASWLETLNYFQSLCGVLARGREELDDDGSVYELA